MLVVDELFADEAAFKAHQARIVGCDWARVTAGLARDYEVVRD